RRWTAPERWPLWYGLAFGASILVLVVVQFRHVPLLFALAFGWGVLAIVAFALRDPLPLSLPSSRGSLVIPAVALLIALVGIKLNLDQLVADVYHKQGTILDGQRQPLASVYAQTQAVKAAPGQDYYWLFLGRAYLALARTTSAPGGTARAQPSADALLSVTPGRLQSMGRGELLASGQTALEEALRVEPLNVDHYANLGRLYRYWGETLDRSKLVTSSDYYRQATTISPNTAHLYAEWARMLLLDRQLDAAREVVDRGLALDERFAPLYVARGDIAEARGQWEDALRLHRTALAHDPRALMDERFEERINSFIQAGQGEPFAGLIAQAAAVQPENLALLRARAFILARLGRPTEAIAAFRQVIARDPSDWVSLRNLAVTYQSVGMYADALQAAEGARRAAPPGQETALQSLVDALRRGSRP
ncbi:MAG: tetratricopeptide repeat protein, partial [Chloroflexi bacterium]|nr:tetratricopeptide repeat protein [Chloroflexota bacterium]